MAGTNLDPSDQQPAAPGGLEQLFENLADLDLAEQFRVEGRSWVELDDDSNVVHRHP